MFYPPVLFKALGFGTEASLMSSAITGIVNVFATFVSIFTVDKFGRRILFLQGGIQMVISQIGVATMIGAALGANGKGLMSASQADFLLILICLLVAAFAWSWGLLGWLVPSEISPLEIRSAGQSNECSSKHVLHFLHSSSLSPHQLKFGLFLFFAGFIVIMTVFVHFFVPETKK